MAQEDASDARLLSQRLDAQLSNLGGRTALAARHFGRPNLSHASGRQNAHDERDQHNDHTPDASGASRSEYEGLILLRADEVFPAASLAKIPIAVELMRRADLGQFDLDERFDTSNEPRVGGGGVLDYLNPAVRLTLDDLCTLMLIVSDNTAANFLLDLVGMGEVNETLSRLNLAYTRLARRFMDFAARAAHRDNVTSASDMLALLSLIRSGALPGAGRLREILASQQSFAELREGWLPPSAALAHKDGSLEDTFEDAGILSGPGGACVYCVLTTDQHDLLAARTTVGQVIRMLWDGWCAR
jgi:beta-lactamase class A